MSRSTLGAKKLFSYIEIRANARYNFYSSREYTSKNLVYYYGDCRVEIEEVCLLKISIPCLSIHYRKSQKAAVDKGYHRK